MKNIECESCIKRKTMFCPNSSKCWNTEDKPYWQNRIMLLEENQQLKEQVEYLRRSCDRKEETIIDLQFELTVIDELEKWLKEQLEVNWHTEVYENTIRVKERLKTIKEVLSKIEELEKEEKPIEVI